MTTPTGAPRSEQIERARNVIDRMFGWKHLRKYGHMSESWMDQLRDGIAQAILAGEPTTALERREEFVQLIGALTTEQLDGAVEAAQAVREQHLVRDIEGFGDGKDIWEYGEICGTCGWLLVPAFKHQTVDVAGHEQSVERAALQAALTMVFVPTGSAEL
ncbi:MULTISPECIES: hypothetical protein [unclassified Leucobacter]|uniref:hypothetical protein n=1 Tax=unclassified Leucobacter TaxID=2621730 RepID=UPI0030189FDE